MPTQIATHQLPPPHQILARVFNTPEKVRLLAETCGVSVNHAYKWLRDGGTGANSDLDRLCKIIFLATTFGEEGMRGAGLIADYVREFFITLVEMDTPGYTSAHEKVVDATALLREANEAVEALALNKPTPETLNELVELRDRADALITRLSATVGEVRL